MPRIIDDLHSVFKEGIKWRLITEIQARERFVYDHERKFTIEDIEKIRNGLIVSLEHVPGWSKDFVLKALGILEEK